MRAKGDFKVNLEPQVDDTAPAGRMLIEKLYTGDFIGTGKGQMLSKRTPSGCAVYSAIEEMVGKISNLKGSFTLIHNGAMSSEGQTLKINIISGSGTGDFENIEGSMDITQNDSGHAYVLNYQL